MTQEYTCAALSQNLQVINNALWRTGCLQDGSMPEVVMCDVCAGRRRGAACEGARVNLSEGTPYRFAEVKLRSGHAVVPEVFGNTIRSGGAYADCRAQGVHIRLVRADDMSLSILDTHFDVVDVLDLTRTSREPRTHLHCTSENPGSKTPEFVTAASQLRIPAPSLDLPLACELVLFNFFYAKWLEFSGQAEVVYALRESENANCRAQYLEPWQLYFASPGLRRTGLADFDV